MNSFTRRPLLVFSDLDGTLLDHDTYDWHPAAPALQRVLALGGGIVLATSKTAAEVIPLREEMGLTAWPAIVENGAGILASGQTEDAPSPDYAALRSALAALPNDLGVPFTGFADMDVTGVMAATGLPRTTAALARKRRFSEPGIWSGSDADRAVFIAALAERGIAARAGGRFLTLSFGLTKADAMTRVANGFSPSLTVALGDAPNDVEMLEAADIGIVIPNPHASALPTLTAEATGRIRRAEHPGPTGWNSALGQVIDEWIISQRGAGHG